MDHNWEQEYKQYQATRAEVYPDRKELTLEEYKQWALLWDAEYHSAWENGPDWETITQLETALCV